MERASAFCLRRAKSQSGGDVAEVAIEANLLAVDAAALRAVVEALCSAGTRNENLSPTEMVTAAAMAAMRAMPGAPVVHHVMPSVVAAAMQMAPLVADRNTIDAPVAYRARTQRNVATDVDGLAAVMRDVGVDTGPLTSATRSGQAILRPRPRPRPQSGGKVPAKARLAAAVGPRPGSQAQECRQREKGYVKIH